MLTQHNEDGRLNMGAAAAEMWRLFFWCAGKQNIFLRPIGSCVL